MNKITKTFLVEIEVSGDEINLLHDVKSWARINSTGTNKINGTSIDKITLASVSQRESLCDKNDRLIQLYSEVEMPYPDKTKSDKWEYGKSVMLVTKFQGDNIIVMDKTEAGNLFEIEACRVELIEK